MKIITGEVYHIYNQGNNKEKLFFCHEDYVKFLKVFRKVVFPHCNLLAYCVMPNHFHFLIFATDSSAQIKRIGNIDSCELSNGFRLLQSQYAQYINRTYQRSGSLFRQKAKATAAAEGSLNYVSTAFHYIHQNPLKAGLVSLLEDWSYSSYADYAGLRNGTLCNKKLATQIIGLDKNNFIADSYKMIEEGRAKFFFDKRDL